MVKSKAPLDVRWSRPLPSVPSTVTVSRDAAGRYFVSCLCGVKDLFVTDTGFRSSYPRHTAKYAARLAPLQRRLSKKAKGSKNRARARLKVARLHAKIADCRQDALHKATRELVVRPPASWPQSWHVSNPLSEVPSGSAIVLSNQSRALRARASIQHCTDRAPASKSPGKLASKLAL